MTENYLKVIEVLGAAIINNELNLSVLKYENKNLKEKLKSIEECVSFYEKDCEDCNK